MTQRLWAELALIAGLILLNGFFAAAEIALITVKRTRLKELSHAGSRRAAQVLRLLEDPSRLFATIQIGVTFLGFLASAVAAVSSYGLIADALRTAPLGVVRDNSQAIAVTLVTVIVSFFTLIFGELTPKNIALKHAERLALAVAAPLALLERAARPLIWLLARTSDLLLLLFGITKAQQSQLVTEDEIRALLRTGREQGVLDDSETEMIHGIFELGDTTAREVMVPRIDMTTAEDGLTVDQAVKLMERTGRSRVPVYRDTIDNIVGIAYATDVNRAARGGARGATLADLVRPAHFVPDSKRLDGLLSDFRSWHTHIAIVVDEYGGTAGMVTLEDVLEEVVGDIQDEFDTEEPLYRRLDERTWRIDARIGMEELNEALETALPTEGFETFGGFIYDIFGKVPAAREKIKWPRKQAQWEFTVESVRKRRIMAVRARKLSKATPKPAAAAGPEQTELVD
ncbi:MAG: hemolysin family protein [Candidatus Edwardsbacteria bacterium]|jgi:putative hemolysin|nr:hemolysin family protein [Candidatus Edwardsbacteria bacterium]